MPLEPYLRAGNWWAKGRVQYQGQNISEYIQRSTGAISEQGAWEWCRDEEKRHIKLHLVGPEEKAEQPLTFLEAADLYDASQSMAKLLLPIFDEIGDTAVKDITPKMVRDLGPKMMPMASVRTWERKIIVPIRAVINNAHSESRCHPIQVENYSALEKFRQDKKRGSQGRKKYPPGSWDWILLFRQHAERRAAALALTMFLTGARISQAIEMHPRHLKLDEGRIIIPGAKGHEDREIPVLDLLIEDLRALPDLWPRGAPRTDENRRVFGYADRDGPRKEWTRACKAAGIERLSFHSAGRHGFGQEMNVRQKVDEKAAGAFGGWSDTILMRKTYTHVEERDAKIHKAQTDGLQEAEARLGITLRKQT
jgi:integrase